MTHRSGSSRFETNKETLTIRRTHDDLRRRIAVALLLPRSDVDDHIAEVDFGRVAMVQTIPIVEKAIDRVRVRRTRAAGFVGKQNIENSSALENPLRRKFGLCRCALLRIGGIEMR